MCYLLASAGAHRAILGQVVGVVVAALALPPWATQGAQPKTKTPAFIFEGADKLLYKRTATAQLHLHLFRPEGHQNSDHRAAIVFFFGGGWVNGTPQQFVPHCRYLASRGMVAITAEYRVKSRHGTSPFACVEDGKSVVRWLRNGSGNLGIAAGGGSAGGHIAAAAGNIHGLEDPREPVDVSSKPNALVLFNPVFDNSPDGYGHSRVKARWREISPLHNIRPGAPPTIVFFGTRDRLVPVPTAQKYRRLMEQAGSRCDLHLYENQTHGFFNQGRKGGKYEATLVEMDKFLVSLGWLAGASPGGQGKR